MTSPVLLSHVVLVIAAGVLFYAAWTDLREFKIRNELILVLFGLYVVHALLSGRWTDVDWTTLAFDLAIPVLMFAISLVFYARGGIAGGDVKLVTICALWAGYNGGEVFAILLLGFAIVQAILVRFGLMPTKNGKLLPFAPAMAAALIVTFMSGSMDRPAPHHVTNIPLGKDYKPVEGPVVPQSR